MRVSTKYRYETLDWRDLSKILLTYEPVTAAIGEENKQLKSHFSITLKHSSIYAVRDAKINQSSTMQIQNTSRVKTIFYSPTKLNLFQLNCR